ncbi:MAG: hypothetical protein AVDCRST_MAG88-3945 [uncultured Thermomicrobiales bacterium]|uniref:Uncharacterized protein n=1 Tax=uncultured Thermomicrobiales bacterium TaxID=1645740 RepID=A0A6J4VQ86_9BACT|nr:MAG: hypothetical protein AVDCRST_MAG88-3945 [uncultured Thermomicrobiales bacterium]
MSTPAQRWGSTPPGSVPRADRIATRPSSPRPGVDEFAPRAAGIHRFPPLLLLPRAH